MPIPHDATPCSSCDRLVLWTTTEAGRLLAVDAEPNRAAGNTAIYRDGTGRLRSRALTKDRPNRENYEELHIPHVANCPAPRPRRPRTGSRNPGRPMPWRRRPS
ncbi:hypothetical protein GCM10027160_29270 [Streptomyces calidiresistens]